MSRGFNKSKNKKRTRPARSRTLLLSALTVAAFGASACAPGFAPAAQAAGYIYQQHTLNAGVLVNGSDPAPYLFYVLNNRPDVRPVDLNLVNPLAPAGALPSSAAYWEVSLNNTSDSQLAQYNVLYLRADGIQFAPNINEKLRRFVDGGGQLIVEYEGAPSKPGLFTGTGIGSGQVTQVAFPAAGASSLLKQPIVSQPYLLSLDDLASFATTASPVPFPLSANAGDTVHSGEFGSLFSPALVSGSGGNQPPSVVSTAQIGAGQVVASTLNIGGGISPHNAATFTSTDLAAASTPDLKLLANILTWSESHSSENKTSHGNASSTGLASFSPAWQFSLPPAAAGTTPPVPSGAAVWGNFVFAVGADGYLRAFDAYPSENLIGGATSDDGIGEIAGSSYDRIWVQPGFGGASAPTVASVKNTNYVFVEKQDGSIAAFNILDGSPATAFTFNAPAAGGPFAANAPGPTVYDGRLYAGQANGTMHVYDLNEGTSAVVTLNQNPPSAGTSESVTAAPSVGMLADGNTNVLIAVVSTNLNVYTVLLGGRNEPLVPYPSFGAQQGYSISRQGRYDLTNIFADVSGQAVPALLPYDFNGAILSGTPNTATTIPQDPLFQNTATGGYFTDWNMDFFNAGGGTPAPGTPSTPVNLSYVSAGSFSQLTISPPAAATSMSAPAIGRNGDYYYTETQGTNSYLVGVRNNPLYSRVQLKFRFLIPSAVAAGGTPLVDGDYVNYTQISGFQFVGAPVVDDQDNVYVAATGTVNNGATSTTQATVLCFRGGQQASATPPAGSTMDTSDTIKQADENSGNGLKTISPGDETQTYGQFAMSPTSLQFYNFGMSQSQRQIAGNLTEPQPLIDTGADQTAVTGTALSMHTNLAWFVTPFAVTASGSSATSVMGLTQVGSSLLLTDGANLYRVAANPLVGTGRIVTTGPSIASIGMGASPPNVVASAPSVGGSVLVINGTNGLAARTRQVTVIADSNRILGVDGDGNAVWAVDATTRTDLTQTPPVSTKVGFSHPTALSQFAPNDYLVADPGSSRCVRFDSAGNVRWELTRFQDPNGLLGAGQPLTLSQPSSVVTRTVPDPDTNNLNGSYVFYLVADSGNNRIVEVEDRLNSTGGLYVDPNGVIPSINHILSWASHTGDRNGRAYRYGSATYYPAQPSYLSGTITPTNLNIAAMVTNTRLAPLTASGGLGAASGDGPGGSLVVFTYPQAVKPFSANAPSDLAYTAAGFYTASASGTYTPFTIRNPRFLEFYAPPQSTTPPATGVPAFDFLYADDNGAFDLTYDATRKAFIAGPDRLQFTPTNYDSMSYTTTGASPVTLFVPALGVTDTVSSGANANNLRANLPFIPTCVQELSSDSQAAGNGTQTTRRYLITQNYSQGELGNVNLMTTGAGSGAIISATGKLGGEVFEVDVTYPASSGTNSVTTPGGFGVNATLSHPALTGPLTQPTYAIRLP